VERAKSHFIRNSFFPSPTIHKHCYQLENNMAGEETRKKKRKKNDWNKKRKNKKNQCEGKEC
jgi:hypothetical protein